MNFFFKPEFRETSLLFDLEEGATSSKQSKASTIAHEMVHQWFGNDVTPQWWDNIWLNEGPASLFKTDGLIRDHT
jgi:aminopeptidase N